MSEPNFTPPAEDFEPPGDEAPVQPLPEPADGDLPEYADDQVNAQDRDVSTGDEPGRDPQALPADRDTPPLGMDDQGTTAGGRRRGDTLDDRLAREEPDSVGEPPD
ncbi:hypothetical protein [Catellatospora tritici]|uniref:hypothetical protein n=1 Tax=Catellatospora tritici TaxID=2851566 RepID=UPI001C2DC134|nr:hypothetical protein [Catellatospora tritici]MBV1855544.1 hypothetical protein [Catellatospora tritici]